MRRNTPEDVWKKIRRAGPDDCWLFMGQCDRNGYGRFKLNMRQVFAHRVAWIVTNGPIPIDRWGRPLHMLHRCDNPPCCNPAHLFPGDQRANVQDAIVKGRKGALGATNANARLTTPIVRAIRRAYASGRSQQSIADERGLSQTHVSSIVRGRAWSHVR
jgi:hypothetical protein